jgi:hypothetical protein
MRSGHNKFLKKRERLRITQFVRADNTKESTIIDALHIIHRPILFKTTFRRPDSGCVLRQNAYSFRPHRES